MLDVVNSDSKVIVRNIFNVTGKSYITQINCLRIYLGTFKHENEQYKSGSSLVNR